MRKIIMTVLSLLLLTLPSCVSENIPTEETVPETEAETEPMILFESDFAAQKAVNEALALPLPSSLYMDEDLAEYSSFQSGISSKIGEVTAENAGELLGEIKEVIGGMRLKEVGIPTFYINSPEIYMEYSPASVVMIEPDGKFIRDDSAEVKVRGNSTASSPKQPYNIKFSEKESVLGMGKGRKWILLADMFDKTLMRNKLALDFAGKLRLMYVPECEYVDVYVNNQYMGVYLCTEAVTDGKNKADIDVENGDFLLELEDTRYDYNEVYFTTDSGVRLKINKPEEADDSDAELARSTLNMIEEKMKTGDMDVYSGYVDVDSFVDYYVYMEYFKNIDAYFSSTRYILKDGKLCAGVPWDNDLSMGNANPYIDEEKYRFYCNVQGRGDKSEDSAQGYWDEFEWFEILWEDEDFRELVYARWAELRDDFVNLYSDNGLGKAQIDLILDEYGDDFARNYEECGWRVNSAYSAYERRPDKTYEENVNFLREWLERRVYAVDEIFMYDD